MQTFRKKPVEVLAVPWLGYNFREIAQLAGGTGKVHPMYAGTSGNIDSVVITKNNKLRIATLEGDITASIGDYIIKGVKGELYPCKPDVFDMTYELAVPPVLDGVGAIAAERRRQIEQEGWTAEHDDQHTDSELAFAACYYAMPSVLRVDGMAVKPVDMYPREWLVKHAKRGSDRIRNLEKAGALIAAEIDRLKRMQLAAAAQGEG